jgi:hypothetical protein
VRNFAVKFALLTARITNERSDPQAYIELTPPEMLVEYKRLLTITDRGVLLFAFTDASILAVLDEEFDIDMDRGLLLFRKTFLDARSIRLGASGKDGPDGDRVTVKEQALTEHISIRLLELTRHLYRYDMSEARLADIRREYEESVRAYVRRGVPDYEPGNSGVELMLRSLLNSDKVLKTFAHGMTADALFKMDASRVLFGEASGYYQAWQRKQIFRHMIAQAVSAYVAKSLTEA